MSQPDPTSTESTAPDAREEQPAANGTSDGAGVEAPETAIAAGSDATEAPVDGAEPTEPAESASSEPPAAEEPPATSEAGEQQMPEATGPVVVQSAADAPPEPAAPPQSRQGGQQRAPQRPPRPKRRRLSAAEKHRRGFFARLSELRRAATEGVEPPEMEGEGEPPQAEAAEAPPEAPQAEAASADAPPAEAPEATEGAPAETEAEAAPESGETAPAEAEQAPEGAEAAPAEAAAEAAPTEAAGAPDAPAGDGAPSEEPAPRREPKRSSAPPPPVSKPRLVAAIDRVGGPEAVRAALRPQQDEQGKPLKWAASCCEAARGLKPGDPAYTAWVRLAATPVREVKGLVDDRSDERGPRGRGRGRGGPRRERDDRAPRGGGGPRRERDDRGPRGGDRPSREDIKQHATDEAFKPTIRIVTEQDKAERREREKREKAEREAKRQAERERLSKFGY